MSVGNCAVLLHLICYRKEVPVCQTTSAKNLGRVTINKTSNRICHYAANYSQHNQVSVTRRARLSGMSPTEFVLMCFCLDVHELDSRPNTTRETGPGSAADSNRAPYIDTDDVQSRSVILEESYSIINYH